MNFEWTRGGSRQVARPLPCSEVSRVSESINEIAHLVPGQSMETGTQLAGRFQILLLYLRGDVLYRANVHDPLHSLKFQSRKL